MVSWLKSNPSSVKILLGKIFSSCLFELKELKTLSSGWRPRGESEKAGGQEERVRRLEVERREREGWRPRGERKKAGGREEGENQIARGKSD
ncbi:hypothetical protein H6P81_002602 [Aristolochia fimbriata]|uniref:Uncharacterized protein n=1 Tax=Aristolochia fimbriata TaxID=158543 RepID=A0AAV7FC04_ARIFI|nr:hypothetical protein H6P81_002602 [Aristolochia fimbriata]